MQAILIQDAAGEYKVITARGDELEIRQVGKVIKADLPQLEPDGRRRPHNARAVIDHKTDKVYHSITDWSRDTELSRMTGQRLLNGSRDEVKGHSLSYVEV